MAPNNTTKDSKLDADMGVQQQLHAAVSIGDEQSMMTHQKNVYIIGDSQKIDNAFE
jgi:hypothetical protein